MKKIFTQNVGYRLIALILALLLFAYVKTDHLTSTRGVGTDANKNKTALMATKSVDITMPVNLNVNSSKYVVSGYQENVKVTLTGSSALVTTLNNTRNFKVYLDLEDYTSGKYTVKYKVDGLGHDIRYKINPAKAKIQISKRKSKDFEIRYSYDANLVKEGYVMGNVKSSTTTVQATGAASEINRISQVVATINVPNGADKDVSARAVLQALDSNGNIVNVVLTPQSVNVTIPVSKVKDSLKESMSSSGQSSATSTDSGSTDTNSDTDGDLSTGGSSDISNSNGN